MKHLKKYLALTLACGFAFSAVACSNPDDSSSGNAPKTEAEIFTYVIDAMGASQNYSGDITASYAEDRTTQQKQGETTVTTSYEELEGVSYDATNKVRYEFGYLLDESGREEFEGKTFVQDNKLYGYEKGTFTPSETNSEDEAETEEDYSQYVNAAKESQMSGEMFDELFEFESFSGWALADDFTEFKNAYDTVMAAQKTAYETQLPEGATLTVSTTSTATGADGVYTVKVEAEMTTTVTQSGATVEMGMASVLSLSAKDGKIVEYVTGYEQSQKTTTTVEDVTTTNERTTNYATTISFSYAFEKAKYDALTVTLPTDETQIETEGGDYRDKEFTVYVNGVQVSSGMSGYGDTIAQTIAEIQSEALGYVELYSGEVATKTTAVKLYKDAAYTQEIDAASLTDEQFFALENIYVKVTLAEGYVFLTEKSSYNYDSVSKAYKIAMTYDSDEEAHSRVVAVGEAIAFTTSETYTIETYVNGVKQDASATNITTAAGQTYTIEYVYIVTDATFMD